MIRSYMDQDISVRSNIDKEDTLRLFDPWRTFVHVHYVSGIDTDTSP